MAVAKKTAKKKVVAGTKEKLAWCPIGDSDIGRGRFDSLDAIIVDVRDEGMGDGEEIEIWKLVKVTKIKTHITLEDSK